QPAATRARAPPHGWVGSRPGAAAEHERPPETLRLGGVVRLLDETREVGIRDGADVDPERVELHPPDRSLAVIAVGPRAHIPHQELPAGHLHQPAGAAGTGAR